MDYCEEFLQKNRIKYDVALYTIDTSDSERIVRIETSFAISVHTLVENYGALIIIIKNALEEVRKQLQTEILNLKNEVDNLKATIEELRPVRENLEFMKKNSLGPLPLTMQATSYYGDQE